MRNILTKKHREMSIVLTKFIYDVVLINIFDEYLFLLALVHVKGVKATPKTETSKSISLNILKTSIDRKIV